MALIAVRALVAVLTFVALALVIIALGRQRRLAHRLAQHEKAIALLANTPGPPDDGHRKRPLRLVALWIPLAAAVGWLARLVRGHPTGTAAVMLTAATATVATLVITAPSAPSSSVAVPPPTSHVHRSRRPPGQPPPSPPPVSARTTQPTTMPDLPGMPPLTTMPRSSRPQVPPVPLPPTSTPTSTTTSGSPPTAPTTVTTTMAAPAYCLGINPPLAVILDPAGCLVDLGTLLGQD